MGKSDNNKDKQNGDNSKINSLSQEDMDSFDDDNGQSRLMQITSLIKKLNVGIGGDISNIPLPSSFLAPISSLDFISNNFAEHFNLLLKANKIDDELERLLLVFKYSTSVNVHVEDCSKCPLNALTGETRSSNFHCKDLDSEELIKNNYFIVEQLVQDPNSTACCVYNKKEGVKVHFNNVTKILFQGTYLKTNLEGTSVVCLGDEIYNCEQPFIHSRYLRGFVEYCGEGLIKSSKSKYYIKTNYNAKPLLGGSYNSYDAKVYNGVDSKPIYKIQGKWDGDSQITDCKTNKSLPFYKRSTEISTFYPEILETDSSIVWKDIFEPVSLGKKVNIAKERNRIVEYQKKLNWTPNQFYLNPITNLLEPILYKD